MGTSAELLETAVLASRSCERSGGRAVRRSAIAKISTARRHHRGFTLIELSVALVLLALIASVLYGSLSLAGESWNRGEAKAQQTGEMRLTEDFLRRTLSSQHPLRFQKVLEKPLYFVGTGDSLSYAAALPGR